VNPQLPEEPGNVPQSSQTSATFTVFYAWQSDCPGRDNRNFIERALELALKGMTREGRIQASPRLDKDTDGVSGIPDIAGTILDKIRACDAFVADVSFVGGTNQPKKPTVLYRPTTTEARTALSEGVQSAGNKALPNPNVMLELGYALSEIGWERIVLVLNKATGSEDLLPFDLRTRRWPRVYEADADTAPSARSEAKKALARQLQSDIEAIAALSPRQKRGTTEQRLDAIETVVSSLTGGFAQLAVLPSLVAAVEKLGSPNQKEMASPKTNVERRRGELLERLPGGKFYTVEFRQGMLAISICSSSVPPSIVILDAKNEKTLQLGLAPLAAQGWSSRRTGEAFTTIAKLEGPAEAATEITADGCINAAGHDAVSINPEYFALANQRAPIDTLCIPSVAFEKRIIEGVFKYIKTLKSVGTEGPWYVALGIVNVKRSILFVDPRFSFEGRAFEGEAMLPPGVEVSQQVELANPQAVARALRPSFDYIWRSHNYPQSFNYAETGDWVGGNG
jgi:hypothetical protein